MLFSERSAEDANFVSPFVFRTIQRDVGVTQYFFAVLVFLRPQDKTNAAAYPDPGFLDEIGVRYYTLDPFCHFHGQAAAVEFLHEDCEFVTAESCDRINLSEALFDPFAYFSEEDVPDMVPMGVVHLLEPVEINHHDGIDVVGPSLNSGDGLPQSIGEQHPVGESGQLVMQGEVAKPAFILLALADVSNHSHESVRVGFRANVGQKRIEPHLFTVVADKL
jgi:hypothetical protein